MNASTVTETDTCTESVAGLLYKEEHAQGREQVGFISHQYSGECY